MEELSIIIGIIGLIISIYTLLSSRLRQYFQVRFQTRFNNITYHKQTNWLLKYYSKFYRTELYKCKFVNTSFIPLITRDSWLFYADVISSNNLLAVEEYEKYKSTLTNSQKQLIEQRQSNTEQKLFNGNTLTLSSIENKGKQIVCEESKYFDLLGSILEYENETTKAIESRNKTPLRDKYLKSTESILENLTSRKCSVGAAVVVCLKGKNGGYKLILHERSQKVVLARGAKSVIPTFSFEPIKSIQEKIFFEKKYGNNSLIIYNIYKEFAEELFNYEEFEDNTVGRKRTDLLHELYEIELLNRAIDSNQMKIIALGHGFGNLVGTQMSGYLMLIEDTGIAELLLSKVEVNWEVDTFRNNHIELVELSDSGIKLLNEYQKNNLFTTSSSFALSRALEWLRSEKIIKQSP